MAKIHQLEFSFTFDLALERRRTRKSPLAARRLERRFRWSDATARTVAELAGFDAEASNV
jgi:hypothetical protein